MRVLTDHADCPSELKGSVLAIGNFDGVHRGHQAVLATAIAQAGSRGAPSGVMVFEPHPRQYFKPDAPFFRLTPSALKQRLFAALGLDVTVELPFGPALARLTAEEFVRDVLAGGLGVTHVVTGADFHFGKGREGNPSRLAELGRAHGFTTEIVVPVGDPGGVFSSSEIRDHLRLGEVREAANVLGYWWRVPGIVSGGDRRGHGLGFPTANIVPPRGFGLAHGIYAARAVTSAGRHAGAAYHGTRSTFGAGEPRMEVFLFDFTGDLYGQEIEIELVEFLRGDRAFDSGDALKSQMQADCEAAKDVLAHLEHDDPMRAFPLGRALAP
ncbi:MAG: bifunctional riboflavin kinase/FAD synthetase [Pseudomonadota bacterium]|nr:bifunctional riboflavin kinase/FAD synthetase [Pseudomonadota bacterium]